MSNWLALGGRKSVKLAILVAGVMGVAIASTGISLAAEPAVQIEVCGNGRSGKVQLSGRNQDSQGAATTVTFPANGCQLVANLFWALPQAQTVIELDDSPGQAQQSTCNYGGSPDRSTVRCDMPAGQAATSPATPVADPVQCNITIDEGTDAFVRGYSLGKTGAESIANLFCGMDREVNRICQNRGFRPSDPATTKITGPVLRPNNLYRADFERQCSFN